MADQQNVILTVKVNKETGALEAVNAELKGLDTAIEAATKRALEASGTFAQLRDTFLRFGSAAAVLAFFKDAITGAEEEAEALRRLRLQVEAAGQSFERAAPTIQNWSKHLQETTRFADEELLGALGRAVQKTGDLTQAQKLVQLAMDLSVASGRNFSEMMETVSTAAGGNERGLQALKREFGAILNGVTDTRMALEVLAARYRGAAESEESLTKSTLQLKNAWGDLKDVIGSFLGPALAALGNELSFIIAKTKDWLNLRSTEALKDKVEALKSERDSLVASAASLSTHAAQTDVAMKAEAGLVKQIEEANRKLAAAEAELAQAVRQTRAETRRFKVEESDRERNELVKSLDRELDLIIKQRNTELRVKNQTTEQKLEIIQAAAARENQILAEAFNAGVVNADEAKQRILAIEQEKADKTLEISQRNVADLTQQLEDWLAKNKDLDAALQKSALGAFDGITSGFGQSVGKMVVSGENFSKNFTTHVQRMKEQFIADVAAMIAKWLILEALTAGFGGSSGVVKGAKKLFGFADGGRSDEPTVVAFAEKEGESAVPDSQARGFALGVLAGQKGRGGAPGGGAGFGAGIQVSYSAGSINITVQAPSMPTDPASQRQIAQGIAGFLLEESADAVRLARRMADLADKNPERGA